MLPISLSTCWNSSRHDDGQRMLEEIAKLGFEYAELSHAIRFSLWPGVVKAVEAGVIKISSVHNFCPVPIEILRPSPNAYQFTDPRLAMRKHAVKATLETIRHAKALNAPAVVMHLGTAGPKGISDKLERLYANNNFLSRDYVKAKIAATKKRQKLFKKVWPWVHTCLEPIVAYAAEEKVKLGFEIREDFEEFPNEEEMQEVLNSFPAHTVGYWHDFGHAARKHNLGWHTHEETLKNRASRLIGCHIHDCIPPCRDHKPLGHGTIKFPQLIPLLPHDVIPVLELSPYTSQEEVLASKKIWNEYAAVAA